MRTILLAALYMSIARTLAYIMDDTNQTIQYSPLGRWLGVACAFCYYSTETYNPYGCNTTDNCHLKIPFTGSGITLYMTLLYTTNFTVSIDGSAPVRYLFVQPASVEYNVTAFDQQSLQFGDHNLDLMLLDANETADSAHNSNFLFDYVVINDTTPPPSASNSSSASVNRSERHVSTGAIAGGVAGGLTALACLCCLVLFYRRRARSTTSDSQPERNLLETTTNYSSTPYWVKPVDAQGTQQGTSPYTYGPVMMSVQHQDITPVSFEPPASTELPFIPSSSGTGSVLPTLSPPESLPPGADSPPATTTLSNEQLDLLQSLAASNTSGPVLATVAQSMVLGSSNRSRLGPVGVAPPPYSPI